MARSNIKFKVKTWFKTLTTSCLISDTSMKFVCTNIVANSVCTRQDKFLAIRHWIYLSFIKKRNAERYEYEWVLAYCQIGENQGNMTCKNTLLES
jgi:hypothetical protein